MKKLLSVTLAIVMILSLIACGGSAANTSAPAADNNAAAAKTYKVAMICDSSISDGGWGAACYNAMIDAAKQNGWETAYSDMIDQSAYYDTIVSYCDLGYDLIYAPGNQYTDAVLQAAEEYPEIAFALLNGGVGTPAQAKNKNVTSLLPEASQIGWIAGAMAGLMTESGTIAFIGGMELDTTKAKYQGYAEAAAYVGEKAGKTVKTLDIVYSNSFSASDKGIEFAKAMIDQGADVFFGDASAVDSGARQAIDEANAAAGSVKIYDIAQPADILGQNECIITSQVTDNSSLVGLSMQAVMNGTFGGEVIYGTLQNGALSAGRISDLVPAEVQTQFKAYIDEMIAGTFMK
jgi:basic membrane protein A